MTLLIPLLVWVTFLAPPSDNARPDWQKMIGGHLFQHWTHSKSRPDEEMLVIRRRRGKPVFRIRDYRVSIQRMGDFNDDGILDVIVMGWSGGAHASFTYYLISLERIPRMLVRYEKGNGTGDIDDLQFRDLNRDGRKEIITGYDGFAYFRHLAYTASPEIPLVLAYSKGRYVEVTPEYYGLLRKRLRQSRAALKQVPRDPFTQDGFGCAVEYYALSVMLNRKRSAHRELKRLIPSEWMENLTESMHDIEAIVQQRRKRLSYN